MGVSVQSVREVLAGRSDQHALTANAGTLRVLVSASVVIANVVGALVVIVLLSGVLPVPPEASGAPLGRSDSVALWLSIAYVLIASAVGTVVGVRMGEPVSQLYASGRRASEGDRRAVLRLPLRLLVLQGAIWAVAVVVFGLVSLSVSPLYGFEVAITTALGGIPTACLAYLMCQRLLRGGLAAVLRDAPPRKREVPGVSARALLAWALGTVPVGGVVALAGFAVATDMTRDELARSTLVLCAVSVWVGLLGILIFARSVADPLQRLRDAFGEVEAGRFDVTVPVFDATEVGYAAASFNRMAAGLAERERLRDLFGRQVGTDVAQRALEEGVRLGGEEREVVALFVDVIGSTAFAADRPATAVVEALNGFFEVVVGAVTERGGLVNKFIGDAALCVFGAPLAQDDPAGAGLAAARDMLVRLEDVELDAAVGIAVGHVVAGNVGTSERYEYTVIGDAVNEAARLTDLAKERGRRVLAAQAVLDAADPAEARHWRRLDEEVTLRGRSRPTRLAEPAEGGAARH